MNITRIRYFLEVGRCKNFSEAAKRLYTAQPNVSRQIAQMEEELGYKVFIRNKHSVSFTPAGEYLYEVLADVPAQLDAYFEHAALLAKNPDESINIGILEGQEIREVIHERFVTIQSLFPDLNLNIERTSFRNLRHGLTNGHYDIIMDLDFDLSIMDGIRIVPVYATKPVIVINSNHPMASKSELTLLELANENFIAISETESPVGYSNFIVSCNEAGFTPSIVHQASSLESQLICVELGKGIALIDENSSLSHKRNVRSFPFDDGKEMNFSAACLVDSERPIITKVMEILAGS